MGHADLKGIDTAGVRESLRRYRWHAAGILFVAIALLVAFDIAVVAVYERQWDLETSGARVPGTVVESTGGSVSSGRSVRVEFVYQGERRSEVVHLTDSSPAYATGERVMIAVDKADPGHFSIIGETNQSPWTTLPMIVAFVLGGMGVVTGFGSLLRARRQARLLRSRSWLRFPVRYMVTRWRRTPVLLVSDGSPGGTALTFAPSLRWRPDRSGFPVASQADACGQLSRYVVLRAVGSDLLMSGRAPLTERGKRHLREAVESGMRPLVPPG